MMRRSTSTALIAALICAWLPLSALAAEPRLGEDGWYRWEVPAGPGAHESCCWQFNSGNPRRVGCKLDSEASGTVLADDCDLLSDSMQIFVRMKDGRVSRIQPYSSRCPVTSGSPVHTLEDVSSAESISWLRRQIEQNAKLANAAIMTLSFHAESEALPNLIAILEDTSRKQDLREEAIFWLVQTESDEAFAYLDRLLD